MRLQCVHRWALRHESKRLALILVHVEVVLRCSLVVQGSVRPFDLLLEGSCWSVPVVVVVGPFLLFLSFLLELTRRCMQPILELLDLHTALHILSLVLFDQAVELLVVLFFPRRRRVSRVFGRSLVTVPRR